MIIYLPKMNLRFLQEKCEEIESIDPNAKVMINIAGWFNIGNMISQCALTQIVANLQQEDREYWMYS